jgi:hypothetical protein
VAPDKVPLSASELRKRKTDTIGARADPRRTFRTGKDTGIGRFPSHGYAFNQAWLTAAMIAQILLAWLKLLALDGDLANAEPKTLRSRSCTPPPAWSAADAADAGRSPRTGPGPRRSPAPGSGSAHCPTPADQHGSVPATYGGNPWGPVETPGTRPASRAAVIPGR